MFACKVEVIQGQKAEEMSYWKVWLCAAWLMLSGQFFVKSAKMTLKHFSRCISGKVGNPENAENTGDSVKSGHFDIQNIKIRTFYKDIYLKFYICIDKTVLFHIFIFLNSEAFFEYFCIKSVDCFLQVFIFSKVLKSHLEI